MNEHEEQWFTGFTEGDGHVGAHPYPMVALYQKERDVLDYIGSITKNWHLHNYDAWHLMFSGKYCIPLLETLSRNAVGESFLQKLNYTLEVANLPYATKHVPTIDWLAGFWDADGSSSNTPSIILSQKGREILDTIAHHFGGSIYHRNDNCYAWSLCGDKSRKLAIEIASRSHCPKKAESLHNNFEGPTHHELHRSEIREYDRKRYQERKATLIYMKTHPEVVERLRKTL